MALIRLRAIGKCLLCFFLHTIHKILSGWSRYVKPFLSTFIFHLVLLVIPVSRTASKWVTRAVNWLGANKGCYWAWFTKPGVPCLSRCLPLLKPYLLRSPPLSQQRWLLSCVYANKPIIHFSRLPLLFQGRLGCLDTPPPFLSCFSTCLVGNLFQSYTKDWEKNW